MKNAKVEKELSNFRDSVNELKNEGVILQKKIGVQYGKCIAFAEDANRQLNKAEKNPDISIAEYSVLLANNNEWVTALNYYKEAFQKLEKLLNQMENF